MTQTTAGLDQIGRVMVSVTDQDAAIAFYTEKLGFELRADVPFGNGDRWIEVGLGEAPTAIALVVPPETATGAGPGGNTNIALTTQDIDEIHAHFKEAGVDVDDEVVRYGDPVPPMFWFRDQDQNVLLVVEEEQA
jgi:catechol 2,3-dioxygenase-like lactoylglutathione lyase family enzyme